MIIVRHYSVICPITMNKFLFSFLTAFASLIVAACVEEPQTIEVSSVIVSPTTLELTEGGTAKLTVTVLPENATDKDVSWSSSDASIASIDDGVVTAKAAGQATITATAGGKEATCVVKVIAKVIPVTSITIEPTTIEMITGDKVDISATVLPENATDKSVSWTTSNAGVATVDNGKVTAVAAGTAVIVASTSNGNEASCKVTVNDPAIPVENVSLDRTSLELTEGEAAVLTATVFPENATDKSVTWTTSDAGIAAVENGTVTAVAAGTAVIVVSTSNGKVASCMVTVKEPTIFAQIISLDMNSLELTEGETAVLNATVFPENTTDKTVSWATSNAGVATVENGTVTAVAAGNAEITVATSNGLSATCHITGKGGNIP